MTEPWRTRRKSSIKSRGMGAVAEASTGRKERQQETGGAAGVRAVSVCTVVRKSRVKI